MVNLLLKKHHVAMFDLQHACMILNPCHIHNADDILQFSDYPKSAPHACHSAKLDEVRSGIGNVLVENDNPHYTRRRV
jgi:hypothetical protein